MHVQDRLSQEIYAVHAFGTIRSCPVPLISLFHVLRRSRQHTDAPVRLWLLCIAVGTRSRARSLCIHEPFIVSKCEF